MFDTDVLLQDSREILGAVPVTLAMALMIFVFSTIIGSLFYSLNIDGSLY